MRRAFQLRAVPFTGTDSEPIPARFRMGLGRKHNFFEAWSRRIFGLRNRPSRQMICMSQGPYRGFLIEDHQIFQHCVDAAG
jgi:hypothetical protein